MNRVERARKRAREDRIRAIYKGVPLDATHPWYRVFNLSKPGQKGYTVWWNENRRDWECNCRTNNLTQLCKHVVRVQDRERKRLRKEAQSND